MTLTNEFDYAFDILMRIRNIQKDIDHPPVGAEISRERRQAEVNTMQEWMRTYKGTPTTGDTAILKYYPLPEMPPPPEKTKIEKASERRKEVPRMLARSIMLEYPNATGRNAWNLLPGGIWADNLTKHTPIPESNNREIRKAAILTIALPDREEPVTFKAFERAWEREKDQTQDQRQRENASRKKEREEAAKCFARQSEKKTK